MPLHINLLHEEQSKIVERKRDPLKLGVLGLLVIAMLFYGFYLFKASKSKEIAAEKADLAAQWSKLEPQATQAKLDEANANASISATASVEKLINDRFYWGPILTEIAGGVGPDIQLTAFDGSSSNPLSINLKISGIAVGKEPRAVAEKFRQNMEDRLRKGQGTVTSQFEILENSDAPLILNGKSYSTANFSIGVQMTPKTK